MSAAEWNAARIADPGRHELEPMPAGGCRRCVLPDDHPVHSGADVVDLASRRRPHAQGMR